MVISEPEYEIYTKSWPNRIASFRHRIGSQIQMNETEETWAELAPIKRNHGIQFVNINSTETDFGGLGEHNIEPGRYFAGILLLIICIVSIVGNISIWLIVLRSRTFRTRNNSFLLVLSAFDLLVSIINMPITILTLFAGRWIFTEAACRGLGFLNMVTLCGSVLSLCNISMNRYFMVCRSNQFYKVYRKKYVAVFIGISIAATIGVSIPPLIGWSEYTFTPVQYICFADWPNSLSYALFMICCCFGIPLNVMIFCNFKIFKTVRASRKRINDSYTVTLSKSETSFSNDTNTNDKNRIRRSFDGILGNDKDLSKFPDSKQNQINSIKDNCTSDKKLNGLNGSTTTVQISIVSTEPKPMKIKPEEIRLATVLGIVVLVFFISWSPYCISMILSIVAPNDVPGGFHLATLLIGYANSCCNPIIYGLLNKRFKDGFKRLYCSLCNK